MEELTFDRWDGHCDEDAAVTCLLAEIVPYDGTEVRYATARLDCNKRMDKDDERKWEKP